MHGECKICRRCDRELAIAKKGITSRSELIKFQIACNTEFIDVQIKELDDPIRVVIGFNSDPFTLDLCDECKVAVLSVALNKRFGVVLVKAVPIQGEE